MIRGESSTENSAESTDSAKNYIPNPATSNFDYPNENANATASICILIPTYNGLHFLRRAVLTHVQHIRALQLTNVNIVISDNASNPQTQELAQNLAARIPIVNYIRQDAHIDNTEEHIFAALRQIDHEYVWTFGDDDIPKADALIQILEILKDQDIDFILGNAETFDFITGEKHSGRNTKGGIIGVDSNIYGSAQDIIAQVGFQTLAACVSCAIFRRDMFLDAPLSELISTSLIYSHVAAYLHAFSESRCAFIADPIVNYRLGATGEAGWHKFSRTRGRPFNHPWTFGIIDHFEALESQGKIRPGLITEICEHTEGHTFMLWTHIMSRIMEDLEGLCRDSRSAQNLLPQDLDRLCLAFSGQRSPGALEMADKLRRIYNEARQLLGSHGFTTLTGEEHELAREQAEKIKLWTLSQLAELRIKLNSVQCPYRIQDPLGFETGRWISLSEQAVTQYLPQGFSEAEYWGRWTDGFLARISIPSFASNVFEALEIEVEAVYKIRGVRQCVVDLWVEGGPILSISPNEKSIIRIPLQTSDASMLSGGILFLRIPSPKQIFEEPIADSRRLGIAIRRMRLVGAAHAVAETEHINR